MIGFTHTQPNSSEVPFFSTSPVLTMADLDREAQRIAAQDDRFDRSVRND